MPKVSRDCSLKLRAKRLLDFEDLNSLVFLPILVILSQVDVLLVVQLCLAADRLFQVVDFARELFVFFDEVFNFLVHCICR